MTGDGRWRYIAQRVTGDGSLGDFLDFNLPLQGVDLDEILSGDNGLTGTITPEVMRLKGPDGEPILKEWGSAIWAEDPDGEIRGGGILTHSTFNGPNWELECSDLTAVANGLPFTGASFWVNVDPIDIYRYVWTYIQGADHGNLGISIDGTQSPVRLGTDLIQRVEFDLEEDPSAPTLAPFPVAPNPYPNNAAWRDKAVKVMSANGWNADVVDAALGKWLNKDTLIQNGKWPKGGLTERETTIKKKAIEKLGLPPNPPGGEVKSPPPAGTEPPAEETTPEEKVTYQHDAFKLNWYTHHDLSAVINDLAQKTPFDWSMTHRWDGDEIRHHIRVGYPRLGRRREELRFVVGENIKVIPSIQRDGGEYANEVLFLGAGEGSAQIMARAFRRDDNRVRRVAVVQDASVQDHPTAQLRANQELARRMNLDDISEIVLYNHPHAPMGSVDLGDEILVEGETGWADIEMWVRVVGRKISPDTGESMVLTVIRSDRLS